MRSPRASDAIRSSCSSTSPYAIPLRQGFGRLRGFGGQGRFSSVECIAASSCLPPASQAVNPPVIEAFLRLFRERGLPTAIRSDNGLPFASPNGLYNLSKLSVWWLRLNIALERIKPGNPQQNGRHERMHRTLKAQTTRPPGMNVLQQQARFDAFISEFNEERPHEAIDMKVPAERYTPSPRAYEGLPELAYPFHDRDILVTACGRICLHRKKINVSTVLAGQRLGIKEVDEDIWLVSFMHYDLGYIDLEQRTLQTIDNPFGTRLSPMS
nr:integrase core domain-containing protein [Steroidobacter denitrificans]